MAQCFRPTHAIKNPKVIRKYSHLDVRQDERLFLYGVRQFHTEASAYVTFVGHELSRERFINWMSKALRLEAWPCMGTGI